MSTKALRGRVLTFLEEPQSIDDTAYTATGRTASVEIEDGRIVSSATSPAATVPEVIDHRPHLILPGFIDPHIHFPQMQVIGSYAAALLEWLNTYTFVEEQKFADEAMQTASPRRSSTN
jgi:guanine deaminase